MDDLYSCPFSALVLIGTYSGTVSGLSLASREMRFDESGRMAQVAQEKEVCR